MPDDDLPFDPDGPHLRRVLDELWAAITGLHVHGQFLLLRRLVEHLGAEHIPDRVAEKLARRENALAELGAVVSGLSADEVVALTMRGFDELTDDTAWWTARRIGAAFGRRGWSEAKRWFTLNRAQQRRELHRKTRTRRVYKGEHLRPEVGVGKWLLTDPKTIDGAAYDAWAERYNETSPAKPVLRLHQFPGATGLLFDDLVAIASGHASLEQRSAWRIEQDLENGAGRYVGLRTFALVSQRRPSNVSDSLRHGDLPAPITYFGRSPVWLWEDVQAHIARRSLPDCDRDRHANQLMSLPQLANAIGRKEDSLRAAVWRGSKTVPPKAGEISGQHFWLRDRVDAWVRRRRHRAA